MSARNWCGGDGPQYKMPSADGAAGAVLATDGSGVVVWGDGAGGAVVYFPASTLVAGATTTATYTALSAFRVTGVKVVPHGVGGAGDLCVVRKGGVAITNNIDLNLSVDKTVLRETTLDYAQWLFAAGNVLEAVNTNATSTPAIDVFVNIAYA